MKDRINNIRFGRTDIETLTDGDIEELLVYNLPADVRDICLKEIARRRANNLTELRK